MVFLSDSLSALQSLQSTPVEKRTRQLRESFKNLASTSTVTLQWIPAHCGIKGNENADRLAKEGGKQEQPETSMSFKESKMHIKHRWSSRFLEKTGNYKPHLDPIHCLRRAAQSTIFRLRTGQSRLRSHLKRIGVAETAFCECNKRNKPQVTSCKPVLSTTSWGKKYGPSIPLRKQSCGELPLT